MMIKWWWWWRGFHFGLLTKLDKDDGDVITDDDDDGDDAADVDDNDDGDDDDAADVIEVSTLDCWPSLTKGETFCIGALD